MVALQLNGVFFSEIQYLQIKPSEAGTRINRFMMDYPLICRANQLVSIC